MPWQAMAGTLKQASSEVLHSACLLQVSPRGPAGAGFSSACATTPPDASHSEDDKVREQEGSRDGNMEVEEPPCLQKGLAIQAAANKGGNIFRMGLQTAFLRESVQSES